MAGTRFAGRYFFSTAFLFVQSYVSTAGAALSDAARAHGLASRDAFVEAATLMPWNVEVLQIPFEGVWLPGYFLQPAGADARARKTVVLLTGFDGTGEELYFQTGQSALERETGRKPVSGHRLGAALRELGFVKWKSCGRIRYRDLQLRA